MTPAGRAASSAARARQGAEPEDLKAPRPRLDVVDRRLRASRTLRRQANLLRTLGVMAVVGALAITAAAHTFVASDQQRIDTMQAQVTQVLAEQQDLQLSRAELESPLRVLKIAEKQLGMVSPGSVSYLAPVNPGPSVAQAGAAAAAKVSSASGRNDDASPPADSTKSKTRSSHSGGRSTAISPTG
ncbi:MAG: hypothetical protein ABSD97_02510 [Acidimicrobiales bacterium]|jgi:cell division protein FtsL